MQPQIVHYANLARAPCVAQTVEHKSGNKTRMNLNYLDFEQPIADLEAKIEELQLVGNDNDLNITEEIGKLRDKSHKLTESIYSSLTPWQVVQVARQPAAPLCRGLYQLRIYRLRRIARRPPLW